MKQYPYQRLPYQAGKTLQVMRELSGAFSLCWVGNDGWIMHYNGCTIAFDLDLLDPYRIAESPVHSSELAPCLDYLFLTHAHNDHFHSDTALQLNERSACRFVLPESCMKKAEGLSIPKERQIIARPGQAFHMDDLKVEPFRALHGHIKNSVYKEANLHDCGYILNLAGLRIYQPGDTVLLHEHLEMGNIDILFVSPTEHNTQVVPSLAMIEAVDPVYILPQHYNTYPVDNENYFWTRGYPDELFEALPKKFKERFVKLNQGEIFALSC